MKTIVLDQPGAFRACDTDAPAAPREGHAIVRVKSLGICGTDLHAYHGKQPFFSYPRILGHELGVEIAEIGGNDRGLKAGDICAVEPYLNCGECIACRRGKSNCCVNMKVLGVHVDGGMREYIEVPIEKLHGSRSLRPEQLALVETIGIGAHAVRRAAIEADEYALVIGAGPIGLGAMAMARARGAQVIALDVNRQRLDFCQASLGVKHAVLADNGASAAIQAICGGEFPTVVMDCTGNQQSMQNALQFLAHGGRLVYVGLFIGEFTLNDPEFHKRETTLLSSRNSTAEDMQAVIAAMESGALDVTPWITHRAGADDLISQFEGWLDPSAGVVKAVVDW